MAYVLRRIEDGKYVASPGSKKSYVSSLQSARVFPTRESAAADACGNDRIVETVRVDGR